MSEQLSEETVIQAVRAYDACLHGVDHGYSADADARRAPMRAALEASGLEELRAAAREVVHALDHWNLEGQGPNPALMHINCAHGRRPVNEAHERLRAALAVEGVETSSQEEA